MSTEPQNPDHAPATTTAVAIRAIAERLFALADGPPYAAVAGAIPAAVSQLAETAAADKHTQPELIAALERFSQRAAAAASTSSLTDDQLIDLAEQIDALAELCNTSTSPSPATDAAPAEPVPTATVSAEPISAELISAESGDAEFAAPAPFSAAPADSEAADDKTPDATSATPPKVSGSHAIPSIDAFADDAAHPATDASPTDQPGAETARKVLVEPSDQGDPTASAVAIQPEPPAAPAPAEPAPTSGQTLSLDDLLELDTFTGLASLSAAPPAEPTPATPALAPDPTSEAAAPDAPAEPAPADLQPAAVELTNNQSIPTVPEQADPSDQPSGLTASSDPTPAEAEALAAVAAAINQAWDPAPASPTPDLAADVLDFAALAASADVTPDASTDALATDPASDESPVAALPEATEPIKTDALPAASDQQPATSEPIAATAADSSNSPGIPDALGVEQQTAPEATPEAASETAPAGPSATPAMLWEILGVPPIPADQFEIKMTLTDGQRELLKYMVTDLTAATKRLIAIGDDLLAGKVDQVAAELEQLASATERTMTFFGHQTLIQSSQLISAVGAELKNAPVSARPALAEVLAVLGEIWGQCGDSLLIGIEQRWPLDPLIDRLAAAIAPDPNAPQSALADASQESEIPLEIPADQMEALANTDTQATWGTVPLALPPEKADLLQFVVSNVKQSADALTPLVAQFGDLGTRNDVCTELFRLVAAMEKSTAEFDFKSLKALITLLGDVAAGLHGVSDAMVPELAVRVLGVQLLIQQHTTALEVGMETTWPLDTLTSRIHRLLEGKALAKQILGWHNNNPERLTELDRVAEGIEPPPAVEHADDYSSWQRPATAASALHATQADIVKVDAAIIDRLLSTVGEMVQQRARLQALSEQLRREFPGVPATSELCRTTESLERSMVTLQTGIMGTRLVPLARLFDNYPRVLRDVARIADRELEVVINGSETLVDKSIIEALADPLMSILRFASTHLIEKPQDRRNAGKAPVATITLTARHQGSQVIITINEDGRGFERSESAHWIASAGLMTLEQAEALAPDEYASLLFERDVTGSPLSRVADMLRGDIGATLSVKNTPGQGSQIDLIIPMKSAILSAVLVAVGDSAYTIPLRSIIEITKLEPAMVKTIAGAPTVRLRKDVFPLIDARKLFGDRATGEPAFALILTTGQQQAALGVDRVISKQDMIIRQIDDPRLRKGPFSGTTLTQDGLVSLVLDVQRTLTAAAEVRPSAASAAEPPALSSKR